jgi:hypothetical protein
MVFSFKSSGIKGLEFMLHNGEKEISTDTLQQVTSRIASICCCSNAAKLVKVNPLTPDLNISTASINQITAMEA